MVVGQTAYYVVVIVLGMANVALAAIAYSQRARQLRGGPVPRTQLALAEERNRMAAERIARLDAQVELLTAIRDSVAPPERAAAADERCVGVIDVGSTTVRLVVVRAGPDGSLTTIGDERAFLHLGAEIERAGGYGSDALRHTAARVAAFQHLASALGCRRLAIVLTAPGRRGANAEELRAAIARATGTSVASLSAAEEARLTFVGATSEAARADQRLVVCDVGGGSTEVAVGTRLGGVERTWCFDIGALTLAERHFPNGTPSAEELAVARAAAERQIDLDAADGEVLVATGGSAKALRRLSGPVAGADELREALELAASPPKRIAKQLHPQRRRSLPAGVLLLSVIQARLDMPLTVSRGGLREGVIRELLDGTWSDPVSVARAAAS